MSACVVWIDSEHAKLFHISSEGIKQNEMKKTGAMHSNSHQDAHKLHQEEHFFKEVAKAVGKAEELLVFGPGMAKSHFKQHLEKHHKNDLIPLLVGVETLDNKMTDKQILEASRKFFKKYNQFHV